MATYIDSEMQPIGKFLHDTTSIKVPMYQRNYSWTDDEVRQVWLDITEALDKKQDEYFLGPMVLKKENGNLEVIDGQQRTASVYIVFSIIRRLLRGYGEDARANWFINEYFGEQDVETLDITNKFHMNELNDYCFQTHVMAESSEDRVKTDLEKSKRKDLDYLLLQAILILWDLIRNRIFEITGKEFDVQVLLGWRGSKRCCPLALRHNRM